MKKILLLILLVILSKGNAQSNLIIPYLLDIETEISIYKFIESQKQDSIAFYFEHIENDRIKIHFTKKSLRSAESNRKLFITDKFYPIIFDTDYQFFVKTKDDFPIITKFENDSEREFKIVKMPNIEERVKNKSLYAKDGIKHIIDWSTFWLVDRDGKLIETNSK